MKKHRVLPPIHPNVGVEAAYRRKLEALVEEMHRSLRYWLVTRWRDNPPLLTNDESPTRALQRTMHEMRQRWEKKFDEAAPQLAGHFATAATERAAGRLESILKNAGLTVEFRMTAPAREALLATIGENVGLIRSIAQEHLANVEGILMRSVTAGRDLASMAKELEDRYQMTKNRAALIARDQNNKATATITRVRQLELGINRAVWMHSHAGKHPRPSHVAFSEGHLGGPEYDTNKGAFLDGEWIFPGQLINCRCVSRPVIEGF